MILRRKGIGTTLIVVVVVIVLVIGTIGFAMLSSQPRTSTSQSTSSLASSTAQSTTNSTTSASGLQLIETINASTITVGQSVNVSVSILNTRPSVNTVLPSSDFPFQGVPVALWPPCYFGLPAAVVVLNGSYSLQDLQKVANVTFSYGCMEGVRIEHVIFQPNSYEANITGLGGAVTTSNETLGPFHMALNFTTAGSWNLLNLSKEPNIPILGESQDPGNPPADTAFTPGLYTIAVADEWGQAVVMHLTVLPAATSSSSSSSSSSSEQTTTSSIGSTTATSTGGAPPISGAALANVTLSGYPNEIALDANTSRIYVADGSANKLTVLDASTHALIDTITLPGTSEFGMAVDAQNDIIYVPVSGCTNEINVTDSCIPPGAASKGADIVEIEGSTNSIVGEIPINVERLAVDPSSGTLYGVGGEELGLSGSDMGYILAIRESTGSVIANTSLNGYPLSLAIDTKTHMLYVSACQQLTLACGGAEVLIINGASLAVQSSVPLSVDALNFPVVVDPETDMVYTMGVGSNLTLFAINGASGAIEYSSNLGGSCAGAGGGDLAMNAVNDQIYVAFNSQSYFLVIDAGTGHIVSMFSTENGLQYVAFNSGNLQVYVTGETQHGNTGFLVT